MKTEIIIIDDSVDLGLLLKKYLSYREDTNILYFQNPRSAKEFIKARNATDLVSFFIVDIMMPQQNGIDLIQDLREVQRNSHFCILTSHKDERTIEKAFKLGVCEYIFKDKTIDEIINKINQTIDNGIKETPEYIEIYQVSEVINQYKLKSIEGKKIIIETRDELPTSALINLKLSEGPHRLYRVEKCDLTDTGALITCMDFKEVS